MKIKKAKNAIKTKISRVLVDKKLDMILVVLSDKTIIEDQVSKYKLLKKASNLKLQEFEIVQGGQAIRWEELDEDLSLNGFLNITKLKK